MSIENLPKQTSVKYCPKSLTPIGVLIDELKSDDSRRRINSIKNINTIAIALGPERTRNELILFLNELVDDELEVSMTLADSILLLMDYIGGPQNFHVLLGPLEKLCYLEDVSIREKATQSLKKVLRDIPNEEIVVQLIKRFINGDYHTAKSTACSLIPVVYSKISTLAQTELLNIYSNLCIDEIPLVRKAASLNLKDMIKNINNSNENELLNCFKTLMKDDQDFVRMYLVDSISAFANTYNNEKIKTILLPLIQGLADDPSWRIRYNVVDKIVEIGQILDNESNKSILLPFFVKSLEDPESEIKTIAGTRLSKYCELLEVDDIVIKIIPSLSALAIDTSQHVRVALAGSIMQLCPLIGKKHTNDNILSIFLQLLKDEFSDVRIHLLKNLDDIVKVIDLEALSKSLLQALNELAIDKNWRTRSNAVEFLSFFAKKMGENFLNEKFSQILLDWLQDKVYGVREAAIKCTRNLTEILGVSWAQKQLLGKILVLQNHPNYLHRVTPLFVFSLLAELLTPDYLSNEVLPMLQTLAKDPVANIRMNTCKTIKSCMGCFKEKWHEESAKNILTNLMNDQDPDVKDMAKQSLFSQDSQQSTYLM